MKTLKLFLIGVVMLASHGLFAQNVQVNNNTALYGNAVFNFNPPFPPAPCVLPLAFPSWQIPSYPIPLPAQG